MVARGILCAVALALLGLCACVALGAQPGLVAHYGFDEGEGTVAKDGSRQGHDGTIHGAGYVRHGDGFALCLDGEDDYVEVAPNADFAGRNEGVPVHRLLPARISRGIPRLGREPRTLSLRMPAANARSSTVD